jgi:hypothetical protein
MESNIVKYDKINGIIKNQCKNITKDVRQRLYNVAAKPSPTYCSETWVLRAEDKRRQEISQMRFVCNRYR